MKKIVLKKFRAGDKELIPGTIVDVSKWRNTATLERLRYIGDAPEVKTKVTKASNE